MPSINGNTGKLYPSGSHDAIRQEVLDRLLTRVGTRPFRPTYGTLLRHNSADQQSTVDSVNDALSDYPAIIELNIGKIQDSLNIRLLHE